MTPAGRPPRPWVIVTDYPRWPSPYFAHLHRHASRELALAFRPDLDRIEGEDRPGVLNLHRLKRLYHDQAAGIRTSAAAAEFLDRLSALRALGWRIAWTVHNLYPIDGQAGPADHVVTRGVLSLADMVLCHTRSDAAAVAEHTAAEIRVTGWAGLEPPGQPPVPALAELADRMRSARVIFLLAGHLAEYKDVPATMVTFLESTKVAHLVAAGTCRDAAAEIARLQTASQGRISLLPERYPPEQAGHLYDAAHAAVCPYRSDGPYAFFASVLHPSSVGTATGFGVPVIAPDLPAISEITRGRQCWLAPRGASLGSAMADAERDTLTAIRDRGDPRGYRPDGIAASWWRRIASVYAQASRDLLSQDPQPTLHGETPGA